MAIEGLNGSGFFITFDGTEGSGKSTQARLLAEWLRYECRNVLETREPGGTEISMQVRQIIMDMRNKTMLPDTELLLFSASRAQLVGEKLRPHLLKGGVVICDRYTTSSRAYQGAGHGVKDSELDFLIEFATRGLKPDLTLLFDLNPEVGMQRKLTGNDEWNRLDALELEFHRRVRDSFLKQASQEPDRIVIIDASKSISELQDEVTMRVIQKMVAVGYLGRGQIVSGL